MAFVKFIPSGRRSATGKPEYIAELSRGDVGPGPRRLTGADMAPRPGERGFVPAGTDKNGMTGT
jgi:hypothetical protein